MKMEFEYFRYLMSGLLILSFITKGLAKPASPNNGNPEYGAENLQSDVDTDYDYPEEEPHSHPKDNKSTEPNHKATPIPYFETQISAKHARVGEDILLECNAINLSDQVILWYKLKALLINGRIIVDQRYKLQNNNTLVIPNATEQDSGSYFCEITPKEIRHEFKLHVGGKMIETIVGNQQQPIDNEINKYNAESISASTEETNSSANRLNLPILFLTVLGMLLFLRI